MCSSQFKVPLVHCNVTSVNPSSYLLLVQSICSCIFWVADPCLWFRGYCRHEFTYYRYTRKHKMTRDYSEILGECESGHVVLVSWLWSWALVYLYAIYTSAHMRIYACVCVCVCAVRAQEWLLALACSSADTCAKGTCSCVILSLWPCYEWHPLGVGSRERQTDPQLMVVLMLLIRTVSGKLKFSPGPKVDLTGFLPAVKRKTAKPLWQHLIPWHWIGTRHTHIRIHTHLHTHIASLKSSCV